MPTQGSAILAAEARAEELRRDGYTLLGPVLSKDVVANLNEEFDRRYAHLTDLHADFENSLQTGDRRYMLTVELSGAFADPAVYANRLIIDVLNIVFEQTLILENCGVALSLPGAKTQHCHRDSLFLFNTGLSALLPPWAVTVGIPLIDMNAEQGTTRYFRAVIGRSNRIFPCAGSSGGCRLDVGRPDGASRYRESLRATPSLALPDI